MVDRNAVRADMQVLGSDGGVVGRVDGLTGQRLRIKGSPGSEDEALYEIPAKWIARTDEHVHLDREAAVVRERWARAPAESVPSTGTTTAESDLPEGKNRLPWILIGIGILIALFLLVRGLVYAVDPGPGTDQTHPAAAGASEASNGQ